MVGILREDLTELKQLQFLLLIAHFIVIGMVSKAERLIGLHNYGIYSNARGTRGGNETKLWSLCFCRQGSQKLWGLW